ncbi:MAG: hypothetical protein AB1567_01995 [bacterium]
MKRIKMFRLVLPIVIVGSLGFNSVQAQQSDKATTPKWQAEDYYQKGLEYKKNKKPILAIESFKKAIELKPLYTKPHREYQDIMEKEGKKEDLLKEYKKLSTCEIGIC